MQWKTFALAGLAGSFMAAGSSMAGLMESPFIGLVTEFVDAEAEGWVDDGYDTAALDTYRIYAQFDQAGVAVTAVGDPGTGAFSVASTDGAFFNSAASGNLPPNPFVAGSVPDVLWDTFVTIGENPALGVGGAAVTGSAPGFDEQVAGMEGDFTLLDTGWFVTAFPAFANSGEDGRVLVAQFTVAEGVHVVGESWRISSVVGGAGGPLFDDLGGFNTIPAPGALALLGFAGLVRSRRRR